MNLKMVHYCENCSCFSKKFMTLKNPFANSKKFRCLKKIVNLILLKRLKTKIKRKIKINQEKMSQKRHKTSLFFHCHLVVGRHEDPLKVKVLSQGYLFSDRQCFESSTIINTTEDNNSCSLKSSCSITACGPTAPNMPALATPAPTLIFT